MLSPSVSPRPEIKMHGQVGKQSCEGSSVPGVGSRAPEPPQLMPHHTRERHTPEPALHLSHLLRPHVSEDPTFSEKWQFWKAPTHSSHLAASGNLLVFWKQCLQCQHRGSVFTVTSAGKEKSKPNDYSGDIHCKVNWSFNPEKWLCLIWLFSWAILVLRKILFALCLEIFFLRKNLICPLLFCKKFWNFSQ